MPHRTGRYQMAFGCILHALWADHGFPAASGPPGSPPRPFDILVLVDGEEWIFFVGLAQLYWQVII